MHILLIEASLSGHHSIYLEKSALAYLHAGHTVTIALPSGISNNGVIRSNLALYPSIAWVAYSPLFKMNSTGLIGLVTREYQVRKIFGNVYKAVHAVNPVDYVFLPYIDYCLYALGLMGSPFGMSKFGGICMRPSFHYVKCGVIAPTSKLDFVKKYLFSNLLANNNLAKLFSIDDLLVKYLVRTITGNVTKLEYLPDPVDVPVLGDIVLAKKIFDTPIDTKVILVYGSLDERKGIQLLLDTLESDPSASSWYVWLIGRQSDFIKNLLASNRWKKMHELNRIQCRDAFVSISTEQAAFHACDAVWAVYDKHYGMSGVIVHAGLYGRCVIACESGLIGFYARTKKIGVIAYANIESVGLNLKKIEDKEARLQYGLNGKNTFCNHTWVKFQEKIVAHMNEHLRIFKNET